MSKKPHIPSYRLHKATGQAVVTLPDSLGGRHDVYLGVYNSAESRAEYDRVIAEWMASGRRAPKSMISADLTLNELLVHYRSFVEGYYRHPDGTPTSEQNAIRLALRPLRQLCGHTSASRFDSTALEAVREQMIRVGRCRTRINRDVSRIKRLFRWAAAKGLVSVTVHQSLATVEGLRAGRSAAHETKPVRPVADDVVEATLPQMTPPVRAMVQLQRYTGMRPGEVTAMRAIDLDTSGAVWKYRPGSDRGTYGKHKNAWRGHTRTVLIGPRGQAVLRLWLRPNLNEFLFQPKEGRAAFDAQRRANRKSKVTPSQAARQRKIKPRKAPRSYYTTSAYAHAVGKACVKAHVGACPNCRRRPDEPRSLWLARVRDCPALPADSWHPNQLRHTKATEIRREAGLDAARAVLGHRSPQVTEVYAELDITKAAAVMERLG